MSKKTTSKTSKTSSRAGAKPQAPRRRTRMIALEPRMLFDGALGLDLSAQATAVAMGDASVKADATTMTRLTAQRLGSSGEHLTADAAILIHGSDFGKGDAGSAVANRLALLTGADVSDVDEHGTLEKVGSAARQEIVFVDPAVRD